MIVGEIPTNGARDGGRTVTIVPFANGQDQLACLYRHRHVHSGGACIPENVRQRFLEDSEDRCRLLRIQIKIIQSGLTMNLREQAKSGQLTARKIRRVRTYFEELAAKPLLLFARPRNDPEEG